MLTIASSFRRSVAACVGACVAIGSFLISLEFLGFDAAAAVRDSALSEEALAGIVSNLGIGLMTFAGLFALLAGLAKRRARLIALATFCLVFAADDAFMLHERLGRWEVIIYLVYAASIAGIWLAYSTEFKRVIVWPLAIAFAAFIGSAVIDQIWEPLMALSGFGASGKIVSFGYVLEDVLKFGGLVCLSALAIGQALSQPVERKTDRKNAFS